MDQVWLQMDKQCFRGRHHQLHHLQYGTCTILEHIEENEYHHLDLLSHLGIHDVLNVNNLNFFEPPILEDVVIVQHPMDNIFYFQPPLLHDKIMDMQNKTTCQ